MDQGSNGSGLSVDFFIHDSPDKLNRCGFLISKVLSNEIVSRIVSLIDTFLKWSIKSACELSTPWVLKVNHI